MMGFAAFCLLCFAIPASASIPRPRGVEPSKASFYKPDVPFRCLDGSKQVPFEYVNDDYCDCDDGSDEPGTSACENGKFFCTNVGYTSKYVLSSRVNDGICDCCDGSDEWSGNIECVNNCAELGKKLREEQDRVRQLQEQGYKSRLAFAEEGKKKREEKKAELERLQKEKEQLEIVKMEMEEKKTAAEEPETEAKDKHRQAWEEQRDQRKAEKDKERGELAFIQLDTNADERVDMSEMKTHLEFDIDSNGEVSDEEAKEHLEEVEIADKAHFMENVWPHIKDVYKPPSSEDQSKGDNQDEKAPEEQAPLEPQLPPPPTDDDIDDLDEDDEGYDEDDDDFDEDYGHESAYDDNNNTDEEDKMPDYDEETKKLIEVADEARKAFTEAEGKLRDTDNQINQINSYLNQDYGPDEEFGVMKGQCYEYTDREYTYKLCPFERASQRPKNGGSETTLGNWGRWEGPPDNKYSVMKYDRGQNCWNGPDRSVKVNLKCGLEHQVTNAFEPSRCEYEFDFSTPSSCTETAVNIQDLHDEL